MVRRHPLIGRALATLAMVLWVVGSMCVQLHEALYVHVMCAEHGVVEHVESGQRVGPDGGEGPSLAVLPTADHGEACTDHALPSVPPSLPGLIVSTAPTLALPAPAPLVDQGAPRGPPLGYAPKTSPPVCA